MADGSRPVVRIPLRRRDGTVRAYAVVDEVDYESVAGFTWCLSARGYVVRGVVGQRGRQVRLHRQLMGDPDFEVDHHDGDPLNNRRGNLRVATRAQNAQNIHGGRGSSRFRGVNWHPGAGKWAATVKLNGQSHYLGLHESEELAAATAAAWRAVHMPFSEEAGAV